MEIPDREIAQLLDGLTHSPMSFALYRLPWSDECHLVLQTSGEAEQLASIAGLSGRKGFVMVPFQADEAHPLVLIRPDVTACGWQEMAGCLKGISYEPVENSSGIEEVSPALATSDVAAEEDYRQAFHRFIHPLRQGAFRKLVLSRTALLPLKSSFSAVEAFVEGCNSYPRMMIYLCHTPASGTWMGSTPEILLSGRGRSWHTVALAGTMPMQADEVMPTDWSTKNREEQACVAEYIRNIVHRYGSELTEEGPYTTRAGQLVHLKTDFRFHLDDPSALCGLLHELHPTPAVCGLPKEEARRFILANEGYDRRYYTGFIGWLDPMGQTNLYVNLRCMELTHRGALLYAGGGILPSSEAEAEWKETEEKMKTILKVINVE